MRSESYLNTSAVHNKGSGHNLGLFQVKKRGVLASGRSSFMNRNIKRARIENGKLNSEINTAYVSF